MTEQSAHDSAYAVAHGGTAQEGPERPLVTVFVSPALSTAVGCALSADVVAPDHYRTGLDPLLREVLAEPMGWVGVLGNARHEGAHARQLRGLAVTERDSACMHHPIGLDTGSHALGDRERGRKAGRPQRSCWAFHR